MPQRQFSLGGGGGWSCYSLAPASVEFAFEYPRHQRRLVGIRTPRALIGWRSLIEGESTSDVPGRLGGHRQVGSEPTWKLPGRVRNTPRELTHQTRTLPRPSGKKEGITIQDAFCCIETRGTFVPRAGRREQDNGCNPTSSFRAPVRSLFAPPPPRQRKGAAR